MGDKLAELNEEQKKEFYEAFKQFDKDGDGHISIKELGTVMRAIGQNPTEVELKEMIAEVDSNQNNEIDFDEFAIMMSKRIYDIETEENTLEAFKVFDKDNKGFIAVTDVRHVLKNMGEPVNEDELEEMIKTLEPKEDKVDYISFVKSIFNPTSQ